MKSPDGSEILGRMTVAFSKAGGEWKIVHWHLSIGVSNVEALGKELPT